MFQPAISSPTPPSTHYKLSSQSYGAFVTDIGLATPRGVATPDLRPTTPLNGPPSSTFLPYGIGKTRGTNGRTIPFQAPSYGQKRTPEQVNKFTPAIEYST